MGSEAGAGHAVGGVECNASDESEDDESFVRMLALNVAPRGGIVLGSNEQALIDLLTSDSDCSDFVPAREASSDCAAPRASFDESLCGACSSAADAQSNDEALEARLVQRRLSGNSRMQDKRGSYDRTLPGRGRRLSQQEYAWRHFVQAEENTIGNPCTKNCPFDRKCGRNISQGVLVRAHQRVYGTKTTRSEDGRVSGAKTEAETHAEWRRLMQSFVSVDYTADPTVGQGRVIERFLVENIGPICSDFCRVAYGFHKYTWNTLLADARSGGLKSVEDATVSGLNAAMHQGLLATSRDDQSKFECVSWWMMWLRVEDQMPNEAVIVHRIVVWSSVYLEEYVEDMKWWGTAPHLSRERWTQLRDEGLKELSIEYFGTLADCDEGDVRLTQAQQSLKATTGGFGEPITRLKLQQRAKHSRFASCVKCDEAKNKWYTYRTQTKRAKTGDVSTVEDLKRDIFRHFEEVKRERYVAQDLHQLCVGRTEWLYEYDDKCGSQFLHLPAPVGGRASAMNASRWQYRFSMQGNLFPGSLLRLSLVPPCLKTGVNFGSTAFLAALDRCAELGVIGDTVYRQTDSGPDNDAKESHALHTMLVSCGAVDKIVWLRLPPKHSHNYSDRANSMVKEVVEPQSGAGGGCNAPWEMEAVVEKALSSQHGRSEFAWHWTNWDFKHYFQGHIDRDFHDYANQRVFVYENAPGMTENCGVKVTYKASLLPKEASSRVPEYRPVSPDPQGGLRTKTKGQVFMDSLPKLSEEPPKEPWKAAESGEGGEGAGRDGWHKTKIFSDIINHTAASFPEEHLDQWRALEAFHDTYPTSDSLPNLPLTVKAPPEEGKPTPREWKMEHGSPISWSALGGRLAWRFERPLERRQYHGIGDAPSTGAATNDSLNGSTRRPLAAAAINREETLDPDLLNVISSSNVPRRLRTAALAEQSLQAEAASLPTHVDSVQKDQFYFVQLNPGVYEGDLLVSLARVLEDTSGPPDTTQVKVKWFARREWIINKKAAWSKTPSFVPARKPNARTFWVSGESLSMVLPVKPELTDASITVARNKDKPRLTAGCVRALREFCKQRGLVVASPQSGAPVDGPQVSDEDNEDGSSDESAASAAAGEAAAPAATASFANSTRATQSQRRRSSHRQVDSSDEGELSSSDDNSDEKEDHMDSAAAALREKRSSSAITPPAVLTAAASRPRRHR